MRLDILKSLNAERAARRPALVVTEVTTGAQRFVAGADVAADPLREVLEAHLRSGKSGMEETPQGRRFLTVHVPPPRLGIDRYTAFVALTHDPKIDDPALLHALARDCFYIGALGSKKTHARRVERLKGQGITDQKLARIHSPIGLAIGAVSPAEIAGAIIGETRARLRLPAGAAP